MATSACPAPATVAIDRDALCDFLSTRIDGFRGPIVLDPLDGGQSNPTFSLSTPTHRCVMRCKPGPVAKLLPSAHAIDREYRVMSALKGTAVPVPATWLLCEDESVIGRAFYLMEHLQGRVLWEQSMPTLSRESRAAHYAEMNRVIAALHQVSPADVGLEDFGRPGNYVERQIARWSTQYLASITQPIDAMHHLMQWLPAHIPDSARDPTELAIVHGDYRLDNLLFHPTEARVLGVLDWELSTLGHPLADFSYHCMSWHIQPSMFRGLGGLDLQALGIPNESAYLREYCHRTGRVDVSSVVRDWNFYMAYNLFRMAGISQGIAKRIEDGTAASAQAQQVASAARPLADMAWQLAQRQDRG